METHIQDPISLIQHYGTLSTVTKVNRDNFSYPVFEGYRLRSQRSGPCVAIAFQESQQECSSGIIFHARP